MPRSGKKRPLSEGVDLKIKPHCPTVPSAQAVSKVPKASMTRDFEKGICYIEEGEANRNDVESETTNAKEKKVSFSTVIGCDEAGRGPLCGPVVAAAAWIHPDSWIEHGVYDSKATTESQREVTYEILVNHPHVKYAVVRIEHDEIDTINILQASLKAMRLACTSVLHQLREEDSSFYPDACLCLVDGNKVPSDMPVKTKSVVKGDSLAFSIAAASILAKVSRDRIMTAFHEQYPLYGLAQHKGYPTLAHRTVLAKLGPSPIHRMSYRPVYESVKGYKKPVSVRSKSAKSLKATTTKKGVSQQKAQRVKKETMTIPAKNRTCEPAAAQNLLAPSRRVTRSLSKKRAESCEAGAGGGRQSQSEQKKGQKEKGVK